MLSVQPAHPSLSSTFAAPPVNYMSGGLSSERLLDAAKAFLKAYGSNDTSPLTLLSYFSSTHQVSIQHCPALCPNAAGSLLCTANAVRSYFDLIGTHWKRSNLIVQSIQVSDQSGHPLDARASSSNAVIINASIMWTWRQSGKSWTEQFRCMLVFDDQAKVKNLTIKTQGDPGTCVMRAVDVPREGASSRLPELQGRSQNLFGDRS